MRIRGLVPFPAGEKLELRLRFFGNFGFELHPNKTIFRKLDCGIDFLGYVVLPHYRLPRRKTRRRVFKKLGNKVNSTSFERSLASYLGYLGHASSYKVIQELKNQVWFWQNK